MTGARAFSLLRRYCHGAPVCSVVRRTSADEGWSRSKSRGGLQCRLDDELVDAVDLQTINVPQHLRGFDASHPHHQPRIVGTYQRLQDLGAKSLSFKLVNQRGEARDFIMARQIASIAGAHFGIIVSSIEFC
jgi:hypothetical protein